MNFIPFFKNIYILKVGKGIFSVLNKKKKKREKKIGKGVFRIIYSKIIPYFRLKHG